MSFLTHADQGRTAQVPAHIDRHGPSPALTPCTEQGRGCASAGVWPVRVTWARTAVQWCNFPGFSTTFRPAELLLSLKSAILSLCASCPVCRLCGEPIPRRLSSVLTGRCLCTVSFGELFFAPLTKWVQAKSQRTATASGRLHILFHVRGEAVDPPPQVFGLN
jgi:hypothetical protein